MSDPTEFARRAMVQDQQARGPTPRELLEKAYGRVWDTRELTEEFEVISFLAPLVCVRRKRDGQQGSLSFQPSPRLYFDFVEDC